MLQRSYEVVPEQIELAGHSLRSIEPVLGHGAVGHVTFSIDGEDLLLRHVFDQISQAEHHDLVGDDENALAAVVERHGVERAS